MHIISDIENECETKNVNNEENLLKAECHRWLLHVFYNCFQIWQPSMPGLLYNYYTIKIVIYWNTNKILVSIQCLESNYICIKSNKYMCEKYIQDRVYM